MSGGIVDGVAAESRRERTARRWYCIVAGGLVEPLVIAAVGGNDPAAAVWFAPVTVWPWIVAGWVRRTWSYVAIALLSAIVIYATSVLAGDDNGALGWGVMIGETYLVAVALGVLAAGSALRRRTRRADDLDPIG